jgi:outer membrane protein assembly factor BamB
VSGEGNERESTLRSLSKETGVTVWTQKVPAASWHYVAAFNGSLVVASQTGTIQLLDSKAGSTTWDRRIAGGFAAEPSFAGDRLVAGTTSKQIFTVGLPSGQIEDLRMSSYPITSISAAAGQIFVGDDRGNLAVLEAGSAKPRWKFRSGGQISAAIPMDGHVLTASHDNFVYFLDAARGGLAWKRRLTGRSSFLGNYLGKYALAAVLDGHSLWLIDAVNGKIAGQIALGSDESVVAAPAISGGIIYLMTTDAVYAYSPTACSTKNDGHGK